jgi:hypothetical protein
MPSIIPEQYNNVNITVSPGALSMVNKEVGDLLLAIANEVTTINTAMNNLTLEWWYGSSSKRANSYIKYWNTAIQSIFGTQDDPNAGALGRLADGISSASSNYAATEQWAQQAFSSLVSGLNGDASSSGGSDSVGNTPGSPPITAILEFF